MSNLSSKTITEQLDFFLKSIWDERAKGFDVSGIDLKRPINHAEVLYLLRLYPFLQIVSSDPVWEGSIIPQFHKQHSGWVIHDYGQALSVSPEVYLFGARTDFSAEAEEPAPDPPITGSAADPTGAGEGTIVKQSFDTVQGMIELAKKKGWPGVEIIAGTELMQWAAWMAAEDLGISLIGYEPTREGRMKRELIQKFRSEKPPQAKPALGSNTE